MKKYEYTGSDLIYISRGNTGQENLKRRIPAWEAIVSLDSDYDLPLKKDEDSNYLYSVDKTKVKNYFKTCDLEKFSNLEVFNEKIDLEEEMSRAIQTQYNEIKVNPEALGLDYFDDIKFSHVQKLCASYLKSDRIVQMKGASLPSKQGLDEKVQINTLNTLKNIEDDFKKPKPDFYIKQGQCLSRAEVQAIEGKPTPDTRSVDGVGKIKSKSGKIYTVYTFNKYAKVTGGHQGAQGNEGANWIFNADEYIIKNPDELSLLVCVFDGEFAESEIPKLEKLIKNPERNLIGNLNQILGLLSNIE
jgi:hypothetical protein